MKIFLIAMLCLPIGAFAREGLPDQPYIYVEGNGRIQRDPDMVTLSFAVSSYDRELTVAVKKVQQQATKVFALLDSEKVAQKDVIAESIRWQSGYEDEDAPLEKRGPKGYSATREFSVVVRDISVFPKVIDELLIAGVEEFKSVVAGFSKRDELNDQARDMAVTNAREQAEKTLQKEKLQIDYLFAISSVPFSQIEDNILQDGSEAERVIVTGSNIPEKLAPSQYRLAPVSITQTVHVIYCVTSAK